MPVSRKLMWILGSIAIYGMLLAAPSVVAGGDESSSKDAAAADSFGRIEQEARAGDARAQFRLGNIYFYGSEGRKKDYSLAAFWFRKAALQRLPEAQFNLGVCFDKGLGVKEDRLEAFKWYDLAGKAGVPQAKYNVALTFRNGLAAADSPEGEEIVLVNRDPVRAVEMLKELADEGFPPAYLKLAEAYMEGEGGLAVDMGRAFELLGRSAEAGDPGGMCMLADFYYSGKLCQKDEKKMVFWLERAAEQDFGEAFAKLAFCHENGIGGLERDPARICGLYAKAAEAGNCMALVKLGEIYMEGKMVETDIRRARQCFEKAAEKGNHYALFNLGFMAAEGIGQDADDRKAAIYFLDAARRGNLHAQFNIGSCYSDGRGVAKDPKAAFYWFKRAAEGGDPKAQRRLALAYLKGEGTPKDAKAGAAWLAKAATAGDRESREILKNLIPQDEIGDR